MVKKTGIIIAVICLFLVANVANAAPSIKDFLIYNYSSGLAYFTTAVPQWLFGGTATTTPSTVEIQGTNPLALTDIVSQCLETDADGNVTGTGAVCSGGGTTIDQLGMIADVTTSTPMTYGEVLRYNTATSKWESVATSTLGFITDLSAFSTSDLTEGTNLYYTQARFDSAFGAKSTTDLTEGTNLYFTDARVITYVNSSSTLGNKSYSDLEGNPSDVITAGNGLAWATDTLNWSASGISGHDTFTDYVANEHIDWTNATDNLITTGYVSSTVGFNTQGDIHVGDDMRVEDDLYVGGAIGIGREIPAYYGFLTIQQSSFNIPAISAIAINDPQTQIINIGESLAVYNFANINERGGALFHSNTRPIGFSTATGGFVNTTEDEVNLLIDIGGNVGVGLTSPTTTFTVLGDSTFNGNVTTTEHIAALGGNSDQWNTAYSWGDWSGEGFLTTVSYSDLTGNPSDVITAGTNLSWSTDTLNLDDNISLNSVTTTDALYVGGILDVTGNIIVGGTVDGVDIASWIDQDVSSASSPTFTGTNFTGMPAASILAGTFGTGAYVFDNTLSGITTLTASTVSTTVALNTQGTLNVGTTSVFGGDMTIGGNVTTTGSFVVTNGTNGLRIEPGATTTISGF